MLNKYDDYKDIVEKHLLDYIPQVDTKAHTILDAMKYSLMSGGKRLRPVLLLAACDFAEGDIYEALPYACALEYIHTYSLIHDDLPAMDNDDLRRGNPTNHKVYGEDIAILAGDGLLNTSFEVMFRTATYHFDDEAKLRHHVTAGLEIAKNAGINGMIAGQICDVENQHIDCSSEMIDFIDTNKTGALIKAPIIAGLSIAQADKDMRVHFASYANCIGRAFQISDDILDMVGDEKLLGKKTQKDEDKGKCNFATFNGYETAVETLHELTDEAISSLDAYGERAAFFTELARNLENRKA